jgi:hypothetical protein
MTYTANVPLSGQTLGNSRPIINANFQKIASVFAVNHFNINSANAGKHDRVELPVRADPTPVLGEGQLYAKVAGVGSEAQMFWRFAGGASLPLQITGNRFSAVANNGYMPLMGGMLIQWGFVNSTTNGSVNFPVAFQTACYQVHTTTYFTGANPNGSAGVAVKSSTVSTTKFDWVFNSNSGAYAGFYWVAIGT